ncbi:hypothetical protein ACWD1Z_34955 [Streptomyces sp. NPDC002784]
MPSPPGGEQCRHRHGLLPQVIFRTVQRVHEGVRKVFLGEEPLPGPVLVVEGGGQLLSSMQRLDSAGGLLECMEFSFDEGLANGPLCDSSLSGRAGGIHGVHQVPVQGNEAQFSAADRAQRRTWRRLTPNRLLRLCGAANPGHLFLTTGLHTGRVGLTVEVHEAEPSLDERWEEIVEVSFRPGSSQTAVVPWGDGPLCC